MKICPRIDLYLILTIWSRTERLKVCEYISARVSCVQQPIPLTFTTPCSTPHSWYLTLKVPLDLDTHASLAGHVRSS